jgi:hypothetical protein
MIMAVRSFRGFLRRKMMGVGCCVLGGGAHHLEEGIDEENGSGFWNLD